MGKRGVLSIVAAGASALTLAAVALAVPVDPNTVDLEAGGGDAVFNVDNLNASCPAGGECVFSIDDATGFGASDAFDGGLVLTVGGRAFADFDGSGDLTGEQLRVGPTGLAGVRVTRVDRGLPGSPTLRSLVSLKNTKQRTVRRTVVLGSALGSDSSTGVVRSSSGDFGLDISDRWAITSDDPVGGSPSDPPITFVHYGKGRVLKPVAASLVPSNSDSFVFVAYRVRLGSKQTRHLLFYTELGDGHADAIQRTTKFNSKRLNGALKNGIAKKVQRKILNWDLVG